MNGIPEAGLALHGALLDGKDAHAYRTTNPDGIIVASGACNTRCHLIRSLEGGHECRHSLPLLSKI